MIDWIPSRKAVNCTDATYPAHRLCLKFFLHLAQNPDKRHTVRHVSEHHGISRNHLVKVVNELCDHGLLDGKRVRTGGIKLAGAPEDITLGLILRLMEPCNGLFACEPHHGQQYILADICGLSRITGKAINTFLAVLGSVRP